MCALFRRRKPQPPPSSDPANHPKQLLVLFDSFPEIDTMRLAANMSQLEPKQPRFTASEYEVEMTADGWRLGSFVVFSQAKDPGSYELALPVLVHEVPLPKEVYESTVGASQLQPQYLEPMSKHSSYALLTVAGTLGPVDKLIMLYKVALELMFQGATGMASEQTWSAFPAEMVKDIFSDRRIWRALREELEPVQIVTGFVVADVEGKTWYLSKGYSMFGVPEVAYRAETGSNPREIKEIFETVFRYMYQSGNKIEAGHTAETADGRMMEFSAPPDAGFLESPTGSLVLTLE